MAGGLGVSPSGVIFTSRPIPLRTESRVGLSHYDDNSNFKDQARIQKPYLTANPNLSVIEVEAALRDSVRSAYKGLQQAFHSFDINQSLSVTRGEFRRVLETVCFPLTTEQFDAIANKVKSNPNGTFNYLDFMEKFGSGSRPTSVRAFGKSQTRLRAQSPKDISTDMLEKMLKEKISKNMKNVYHTIRLHDYNNDGHIQKHELRRVLENTCFKISDAQFDKLYNRYDFHRRGIIDYNEFLVRLGLKSDKPSQDPNGLGGVFHWNGQKKPPAVLPGISKSNKAGTTGLNLDQMEVIFRKKLQENFANVKKMFLAFDKHLDGFLDLNDLKSVLSQFTLPMTDKQFTELMERFGFKVTGRIPWQFFLNKFSQPGSKNAQAIPLKSSINGCLPIMGNDQSTTLEGLLRLLHDHVTNYKSSYREVFLELDKTRQGHITRKDFSNVIKSFKLRVNEAMLKQLFAVLDPENLDKISYHNFLDLFEPRESAEGHKWLKSSHRYNDKPKPVIMAWKTVEAIVKDKIQSRWKEFSEALLKGDSQENGTISRLKMKKILEKYTIPISAEHFNELSKRCGTDDTNENLDYVELLLQLAVTIKPGDLQGVSAKIQDASQEAEDKRMAEVSVRQDQLMQNLLDRTVGMSVEEVMTRLRDHITQQTPFIRKAFMKYDRHNKGQVSKKDFKAMLESVGFYMTKEQFEDLWSNLGVKNGHLDYVQFVKRFEDPRIGGLAVEMTKTPSHRVNPIRGDEKLMTAEVAEKKLRAKIILNYEDLHGAFDKYCQGESGLFGQRELQQMLDAFMCPIDKEEFYKLSDNLGLSKNAKLSYPEFLNLFDFRDTKEGHPWLNSDHRYNNLKPLRGLKAEEVHKLLVTKAHMRYNDMAKAFTRLDSTSEGVITKRGLKEGLSLFMIPVEKEEFDKLWQRYDSAGKGHLSHKDFLQHLVAEEFSPGDQEGTSKQIQINSFHTIQRHHQTQLELHEKNACNQAQYSAELSPENVIMQLKGRLNDQYSDLRSAFKAIDARHKDHLTSNDFQKLLVSYNYILDDDQFYDFLQMLGLSSPKSRMTYTDFLEVFEESRREQSFSPDEVLNPELKFESLSNQEIEAKIHQKVDGQTDVLQKAFQAFDQTNRGLLSLTDFRSVIDNFCLKLTNSQFKHILSKLQLIENMVVYSSFLDFFSNTQQNFEQVLAEVRKQMEPEVSAPLTIEEIMPLISENVTARFYMVAKAFSQVDYARIGVVSKDDFKKILFQHILRVNDEQFDKLWQNLPVNEFGNLQYDFFMRQYGREPSSRPDTSMSRSTLSRASLRSSIGRPFTPLVNAEGVENSLFHKMRFHWKEIQKMCRFADPNNTGKIPPNAIKAILNNSNIRISTGDLETLILKFDLHNDGQFCYKDFLRHFVTTNSLDSRVPIKTSRGKLPAVHGSDKNDSLTRLQQGVSLHWRKMRQDLTLLDQDSLGVVSPMQLRQVFKKYGINLSEDEFFHLVVKYDENQTGQVNYNTFLKSVLKSL